MDYLFEGVDRSETAKEDIALIQYRNVCTESNERAVHSVSRKAGDVIIAHDY